MGLTFKITENDEEIRYEYKVLHNYFLYGSMFLIFLGTRDGISSLVSVIGIFIMFYNFIVGIFSMKDIYYLKKVMREKNVVVSGSKWSSHKPLTYIIQKDR